jgi:hypothetical protein
MDRKEVVKLLLLVETSDWNWRHYWIGVALGVSLVTAAVSVVVWSG